MKTLIMMMTITAFTSTYAQEKCCEEPKTYPRVVYHSHVEGQKDIWSCQPYSEDCCCEESELLGEYPRSYIQRVDSDATAYPGRREDAIIDSSTE